MAKNKRLLVAYKTLFGLLGLSAVATEIIVLINRGQFVPANFFSFFTIETNIFAAVVLFVSAIAVSRNKQFKHLAMFRGAAALYMMTTGMVFSIFLSGLDPTVLTAVPWDNMVLHFIMPIAVLTDWLVDPPKGRAITFKKTIVWLVYPIIYVVYSLLRGHAVGWYPYPFLDPANDGYLGVFVVSLGIAAAVLGVSWLLIRFTKKPFN